MHRKSRMPYGRKYEDEDIGYRDHNNSARNSLIQGAIRNGAMFAIFGLDCSFKNSFIASASGCGIPEILTLFGPLRIWK